MMSDERTVKRGYVRSGQEGKQRKNKNDNDN